MAGSSSSSDQFSGSFEKLKNYFETRPACKQALAHLRKGVEISIIIGHQIECALFFSNGQVVLEKRPAKNFDVVFQIKPESVDVLVQNPGVDVGDLGIAVLKEYLSGGLRIRVTGSSLNMVRNGYLSIIKEGGVTFAKFLASYGVTNASKIVSVIKSLRKET